MKIPNTTQEQEANQLWQKFKWYDQETFWKKYEHLLTQNKAHGTTSIPDVNRNRGNTLNDVQVEVFKPSFSNYLGTGAAAFIMGSLFIMLVRSVIMSDSEKNTTFCIQSKTS